MNKQDLKNYKGNDVELTSLVPGINNLYSVGSGPVRGKKLSSGDLYS